MKNLPLRHLFLYISSIVCLSLPVTVTAQETQSPYSKKAMSILKKGQNYAARREFKKSAQHFARALRRDDLTDIDKTMLSKQLAGRYVALHEMEKAEAVLDGLPMGGNRLDRAISSRMMTGWGSAYNYAKAGEWMRVFQGTQPELTATDYDRFIHIVAHLEDYETLETIIAEYQAISPDYKRLKTLQTALAETGNREAVQVSSMPPRFAAKATRSGHCKLRFDVTPKGHVDNIETLSCSHPIFKENSEAALAQFIFLPKLEGGVPVVSEGLERTLKYKLSNRRGTMIPE